MLIYWDQPLEHLSAFALWHCAWCSFSCGREGGSNSHHLTHILLPCGTQLGAVFLVAEKVSQTYTTSHTHTHTSTHATMHARTYTHNTMHALQTYPQLREFSLCDSVCLCRQNVKKTITIHPAQENSPNTVYVQPSPSDQPPPWYVLCLCCLLESCR